MDDRAIAYELCRACRELRVRGLPCSYCGDAAPDDMELCEWCGEVKVRGRKCTSPKHTQDGE